MPTLKPKIIRACTVSDSISFISGMIPDFLKKFRVGVLASPGEHWKDLDGFGDAITRHKVRMERHIAPKQDLVSLFNLIRLFRKERPDMVHSMTPKAGMLCMLAAWLTGVPVRVHIFTGLVFPTSTGLKRRILMAADRLTCACATHIIPEGEGVKRDLLNNGITKKPIRVLGYGNCQGIDLNRFDRTEEVMHKAEEIRRSGLFTFIAIGRMVGDKGINEMVAAFRRLNRELPDTRLILVGPEERELDPLNASTIDEIERNTAIEAVGSQRDVRPWLAASDCAVLASYREGFPNVVIEAGAMGLPQIVTDINGANEIIEEGVNGSIIPPKDEQALYEAMKRMAQDSSWREGMASNARERIASRYEQSFVRKSLYDFYDEIMPITPHESKAK